MVPFGSRNAIPGKVLRGIDASTLFDGLEPLKRGRIDDQLKLIATNQTRWDMIEISIQGVILSGNHGARAAAEADVPIDVLVRDFYLPSCGPILSVTVIPGY